eukprot:scaffold434_cov186-Pinguiococcus_pyrenoidosus.AAC.57
MVSAKGRIASAQDDARKTRKADAWECAEPQGEKRNSKDSGSEAVSAADRLGFLPAAFKVLMAFFRRRRPTRNGNVRQRVEKSTSPVERPALPARESVAADSATPIAYPSLPTGESVFRDEEQHTTGGIRLRVEKSTSPVGYPALPAEESVSVAAASASPAFHPSLPTRESVFQDEEQQRNGNIRQAVDKSPSPDGYPALPTRDCVSVGAAGSSSPVVYPPLPTGESVFQDEEQHRNGNIQQAVDKSPSPDGYPALPTRDSVSVGAAGSSSPVVYPPLPTGESVFQDGEQGSPDVAADDDQFDESAMLSILTGREPVADAQAKVLGSESQDEAYFGQIRADVQTILQRALNKVGPYAHSSASNSFFSPSCSLFI